MYNTFFLVVVSVFACVDALPVQNETVSTYTVSNNSTGGDKTRQGWTFSKDRSTMDILWSCGSTIILCCWSMICLNVPGPNDTSWIKFRRRALIFALTLCGPEVASITAMGQYLSADQSVKDFASAGFSNWSLQHAFFADMGGFILETRDWVPFPINAKQLLWLVKHGYVSVSPELLGRIKDKNKIDGMMRFIMVFQSLWFLANFFTRLAQGLAITAIELTTVAFIYSGLPMMFLWRHKPADVGIAEVLVTDSSMAEILLTGGDAAREPYSYTPLDFINRKEWAWTVYWSHLRGALSYLHITAGSRVRPLDRFSNFNTPEIPTWIFCGGAVYYFGFAAIFISGWNLSLPTNTEQLLWRVASLLCLVTLFAGEVVTDLAFKVWPYLRAKPPKSDKNELGDPCNDHGHESHTSPNERGSGNSGPSNASRLQPRTIWDWMRNNSPGQDPQFSIQLRVILPIYVLVFGYFLARAYIIVEDFLELRSLPLSCYQAPDWQQIVPHFG